MNVGNYCVFQSDNCSLTKKKIIEHKIYDLNFQHARIIFFSGVTQIVSKNSGKTIIQYGNHNDYLV